MTTITLYGIPNCDAVKRARARLLEHGRDVVFHDFKKAGVPADRLDARAAAVGWERMVNRSGTKRHDVAQASTTRCGPRSSTRRARSG